MIIAKQVDIRANIKEYFDKVFDGETIIVPRKENRNVVIISEAEYNKLNALRRLEVYSRKLSIDEERVRTSSTGSVKESNVEKLNRIKTLKDGWNGNGAPKIPLKVIRKTLKIIENLDIQPEVFPTALKSIQLEFDNSRHDHMEIEVGEDDEADVFIVTFQGTETEETIPASYEAISERVRCFYR